MTQEEYDRQWLTQRGYSNIERLRRPGTYYCESKTGGMNWIDVWSMRILAGQNKCNEYRRKARVCPDVP